MRRLRTVEEPKACKREAGFDRIEMTAEMDEHRFCIGLDSGPFNTKLYNPRWPHTLEEHKLVMDINVEKLRMGILLSQPAPPPQYDPSSRRSSAVDTGSGEPGTPHAKSQSTKREKNYPLQAGLDSFCTSVQAWIRRVPLFCFNQTLR